MSGNKLYLSNSGIQVFLNCKRKYKFKYINKIKSKQQSPSKYLAFGNSMHITLAQFNMITDKKYRTIDNLHMLLRKNWKREGYESLEEEREYGLKALSMLSNYFDHPKDQGKKNVLIETMINKNMDGKFTLCGKLDKVYVRNDGLIETIDYKTGKNIETFNNMQLPIYILLTKEKLGRYPNVISYYYMAYNKKIEQEVSEEVIEDALNNLWNIYKKISTEKEFSSNPNTNCKMMCEYYDMCNEAKDSNSIMTNILKNLKNEKRTDTIF